jgi:hypothetical protein
LLCSMAHRNLRKILSRTKMTCRCNVKTENQNEPISGNFEKAAEANSLFACHISLDGRKIFLRTLTVDDCSGGVSFPRWQLGVLPELSVAPASKS